MYRARLLVLRVHHRHANRRVLECALEQLARRSQLVLVLPLAAHVVHEDHAADDRLARVAHGHHVVRKSRPCRPRCGLYYEALLLPLEHARAGGVEHLSVFREDLGQLAAADHLRRPTRTHEQLAGRKDHAGIEAEVHDGCFRQVVEEHAVARLAAAERLLGSHPIADVAGDRGRADHPISRVDRRQRQRHILDRAILGNPARLVLRHRLAGGRAFEKAHLVALEVVRDEQRDVPADGLLGRPSVEALGTSVPARDDAVEILREDRVL